jgi:hypothetical protein
MLTYGRMLGESLNVHPIEEAQANLEEKMAARISHAFMGYRVRVYADVCLRMLRAYAGGAY